MNEDIVGFSGVYIVAVLHFKKTIIEISFKKPLFKRKSETMKIERFL